MTVAHGYLKALLKNLRIAREKAGLTDAALEERLILGPGWIDRFEEGTTVPSIDMLLAILHETGSNLNSIISDLPDPEPASIDRHIFAEQVQKDTLVHFKYANHDAKYLLVNSTIEQFEVVIKTLRDGLAKLKSSDQAQSEMIKTEAVATAFLKAVELWPHCNPSDIWWFVVYRAYCDPYNHPAKYARLDFTQSWKRTGGWALEELFVRHYAPLLKTKGINLFIADGATKNTIVENLKLSDRVEADKIDVVLTGDSKGKSIFFGVVHVKASFAERRTDDVPLSITLKNAGYVSPLLTMDCKSTPSINPINKGELGDAAIRRSAKRKDIEDEGYFSGCFSYNKNTISSPTSLPSEQRIHVCDFSNPDDAFSQFITKRWQHFLTQRKD